MILDKLKNRYSYNVLALLGWLSLLIFICIDIHIIYGTFAEKISGSGILFFYDALYIFSRSIIFLIIFLLLFLIEIKFQKRIENEKYIKSKLVSILQILGILFVIIPIILISWLYIYILRNTLLLGCVLSFIFITAAVLVVIKYIIENHQNK